MRTTFSELQKRKSDSERGFLKIFYKYEDVTSTPFLNMRFQKTHKDVHKNYIQDAEILTAIIIYIIVYI